MEIAITPQENEFFNIFDSGGEFPIIKYAEDGFLRSNTFSLFPLERNFWSNSITTIQRMIDEFYVRKQKDKDVYSSQIIHRSYFIDFENAIENENVYDSLPIDIKGYTEQFEEISNLFCFNKTEWAKIFSVSRVTVYDWLNRKTTPTGDNANKIRSIYKLSSTLSDKGDLISRTYLHQNISKYNKSLMEIFLSSQDIVGEYQNLDKTIVAMINHSGRNKERLVKLAKSKRPKDEILDYNLKKLNY